MSIIAINYKVNKYVGSLESSVYMELSRGGLLYMEGFKEGTKNTIVDYIKKGLDIRAYCFVAEEYDQVCASENIENISSSENLFRNKYGEEISASCLYDQKTYDDYKSCNNFLVGLFSGNDID